MGARFGGMQNPEYRTRLSRYGAGIGTGLGIGSQRRVARPRRDFSRTTLRYANPFGAGTGFHLDPTPWHFRGVHPMQHAGQAVQAAGVTSPFLHAGWALPAAGYHAYQRGAGQSHNHL
jgi:hypothetical protein